MKVNVGMLDTGDTPSGIETTLTMTQQCLDHLDQGVSVLDRNLRLVLFNNRYRQIFDFPTGFLRIGMAYEDIVRFNAERGEYGDGELENLVAWRMARLPLTEPFYLERLRPNGRFFEMRGSPLPDGGAVFSYSDITRRKQEATALVNANRALKTLSSLGKALAHATTEQELLNEACRIIVNVGGYQLAWVGVAVYDKAHTVQPVAHHGHIIYEVEDLKTTWCDQPNGNNNPTGNAIRLGRPAISRDVTDEADTTPSFSVTSRHGYRSVVALPLHEGTTHFSALTICATDADAFTDGEVSLLVDVANDLAYGLRAFRHGVERRRALDELRHNLLNQETVATILRGSLRPRSMVEFLNDTLALVVASQYQGLLQKGCIFLMEEDGRLAMKAHYNLSDHEIKNCAYIQIGWCLCGQAAESGEMIHAGSVDGRHAATPVHDEDHGHYCVPIRSGKTVLGILNLYVSSGHQSDPALERFVTTVADTLAGVIRRRHAEEALSRAHDDLERQVDARTCELRQEIEERQATDLALRRSERKYRTVIDTALEGFWMIDATTRTVDVNDALCQMLNCERDEIIGRSLLDFADSESRELLEEQLVTSLWQDRRSFEAVLTARNGRRVFALFHATMFENASGNLRGQFAFVSDITARKTAEAQLRRAKEETEAASRAKSEFLAGMSHELRTPLNAIIGFSDAIISEVFGPLDNPRYREYIDDIHRSGSHLLALINDILDVAKVEAGKMELREEVLEIAPMVRACLRLVRTRAAENGVRLRSQIASDIPLLFADERRMKQILLNLLTNAVKFTPDGEVTVRAEVDAMGRLMIVVADNGVGMTPKDLAQAMEPYQQIDNAMTRKEGTGLGLPLTRGLVEAHGGVFDIASQPDVGTVITVWFPSDRVRTLQE